jgi:hypothetical protein
MLLDVARPAKCRQIFKAPAPTYLRVTPMSELPVIPRDLYGAPYTEEFVSRKDFQSALADVF